MAIIKTISIFTFFMAVYKIQMIGSESISRSIINDPIINSQSEDEMWDSRMGFEKLSFVKVNDADAMPCPNALIAVLSVHTPEAENITGTVEMMINQEAPRKRISIKFNISGMDPGSVHGCHIHTTGNLMDHCNLTGVHFNPLNKTHGGPRNPERHVGDIVVNVIADNAGNFVKTAHFNMNDKNSPTICGKNSVLGRAVVLHMNKDDHGLGNAPTSNTTGNSGAKIACGVLGIMS